MPFFGQEIMIQAQAKGPLTEKKYLDALASNLKMSRTDGIDATMDKYKLDAIVAPTGSPAWPTDLINGDHFTGASSTPAAVAGYPNINVPAGFSHGLPVGISFFGRAVQRADADQARVRLRAVHQAPPSAAVHSHAIGETPSPT